MDNFFGADPELVRQALKAQGSDYQLPPLDPSLSQMPGIGPAPAPVDVGALTAPQPTIDPHTAPASLWEGANAALGQLDKSVEQQAQAAGLQGAAREQGFAQQADIHASEIREAETLLAQHRDRSKALEATHAEALERFRTAQAEAAAMPPPKDRRSSSQRTMSALALGMGSIADHFAMVGGAQTNNADQIQRAIDNKIERDLNAQREAIAHKQGAAQGALNELSIAQKHFGLTTEADQYATALIKEKTAAELGQIAANTSNREVKAQVLDQSARYHAAAAAEKLDLYKTMMKKKLSALDVVMMKQAGMTDAQIREYDVQTGGGVVGPPSAQINGPLTKSQAGAVNVAGHQASIGSWRHIDPSKADPVQTRKVQDYFVKSSVYSNTLSELETLYRTATNPKASENERALATTQFGIKRDEAIAKLSQKDDQGVVTNPEFARKVESLKAPPRNVIDESLMDTENWWKGTTSGPEVFAAMRKSAERERDTYMRSNDWTVAPVEAPSAPAAEKGAAKPTEVRKWKPGLPVPGRK